MAIVKERGVLLETEIWFSKGYPNIELAEGLQLDELTEGDPNPFFVTLPVARENAQSRNGRIYPPEAVQSILKAITEERITGQLGHLREDERGYTFNVPVVHWVGATMVGDTLWAKGYVPQSAQNVREYLRLSMKSRAKTGTSLYGTAEVDQETGIVLNLDVEQIDFAHAKRVGVLMTAATPTITSETVEIEKEESVPQATQQTAQETTVPATDAVRKLQEQIRELQGRLDDQSHRLEDYARVCSLMDNPEDPVLRMRAFLADMAKLRLENGQLLEETIVSKVADKVKPITVRPIVEQLVRDKKPVTKADVLTALDWVMGKPEVKSLLQIGVQETMGPQQNRPVVSETPTEQEQQYIIIPEVK